MIFFLLCRLICLYRRLLLSTPPLYIPSSCRLTQMFPIVIISSCFSSCLFRQYAELKANHSLARVIVSVYLLLPLSRLCFLRLAKIRWLIPKNTAKDLSFSSLLSKPIAFFLSNDSDDISLSFDANILDL